jgi:cation:H+ antiporter
MTDVLLLLSGLVVVVAGADMFFDALLGVSARLRMAPFVITAIVSGFELENLAAGIAANAKGLPGAAAGTFLGGTTFLALGVTGLAAVITPLKGGLPWKPLAAAGLSPLALLVLSLDRELSRVDGTLLIVWFFVVMIAIARTGRDIVGDTEEGREEKSRPMFRLVGGLTALSLGGEVLGEGIRGTVERFGINQSLLGNTAIAASVEAEEVIRVSVPAKRGRSDVALGNIIGTVAHFIAFNAGVIALVRPLEIDDVTMNLHMPVAVVCVPVVCALVAFRKRVSRAEGTLLLLGYLTYIGLAISATI